MKSITVFINNKPLSVITVTKDNKISDIKNNFPGSTIKMFLNPTTELPVFNSNEFDNLTLETVWDQMNNSVILLTREVKEEEKEKQKQRVWSQIPDVDKIILTKLSYKDLLSTCQTSTYLSFICDNNLWRQKIVTDFPLRGKYLYFSEYLELYKNNPRKLYEIINRQSKIVTLDKDDFPKLVEATADREDFGYDNDDDLDLLDEEIKKNLKTLPLLRGDVIFLGWNGEYRNEDKFIWDGEKVNALETEIDGYGSVPKEFTFPEFPLDHFFRSIVHNHIIWLSPSTITEIKRNYTPLFAKRDKYEFFYGTSVISDRYENYNVEFFTYEKIALELFKQRLDNIKYVDISNGYIFIKNRVKTFKTLLLGSDIEINANYRN